MRDYLCQISTASEAAAPIAFSIKLDAISVGHQRQGVAA